MPTASKAFNGPTGAELIITIPNEVKRALDRAGINSPAITYPNVRWSWEFRMWQYDVDDNPTADTPDRELKAGEPMADSETLGQRILVALSGGSKRFKHQPPSPTEIREAENLPKPEG